MFLAAVSVCTSYPENIPQPSFTIEFRFDSQFLCTMFIWDWFYRYNANNFTFIIMSLNARSHSIGSRDFKMVALITIMPQPFSYDDFNFLKGPSGNTPSLVYGNIPSPPISIDFQLLTATNKKVQMHRVFLRL